MRFISKFSFTLAILTGMGLTTAAYAQSGILVLGDANNSSLSGNATLTDTGTTTSGTFTERAVRPLDLLMGI